MKTRLISDIHNDLLRHNLGISYKIKGTTKDKKTILILNGDIERQYRLKEYANAVSHRFKMVIIIAGNHEYHNTDYFELNEKLSTGLNDNVFFLNNSHIIVDEVIFIGSTLWSNCTQNQDIINNKISDFSSIQYGDRPFQINDMIELNKKARLYLTKTLMEHQNYKKVVCTHFSPSELLGNIKSDCFSYFHNTDMEDIITESDYWMFAHTHENIDRYFKGTRMISNCLGYHSEKTGFDPIKIIDIN